MIDIVILALWFFAPAGIANATPVFAKRIPYLRKWKTPLDFGKSFKGKRILGDNKTWRGFCFGVILASLVFWLQKYLYIHNDLISSLIKLDYASLPIGLGILLGIGALLGDAIESFFKRQLRIPSGEAWFPFDQIDYIIGGILLSSLVITLTPLQNVTVLLVWFGLHLVSSYVGYLLGLKDKPI